MKQSEKRHTINAWHINIQKNQSVWFDTHPALYVQATTTGVDIDKT